MNFLPIVTRELRVVSRKPWIYWVRPIFGIMGITIVLMLFFDNPARSRNGVEMLWGLSVVTMLLALLSGCFLTADCISSEKREDTLGLLFLTNLKGYDVVLGKISTNAINTATGLLGLLPVFFLPILAGGVTWAETLRVLLGISVAFLFALSLGVWVSARSLDARNSVMATLLVIFLLITLPLLWIAVLDGFFRVRPWLAGVPQLSPGMLLFYARDSWYFTTGAKTVYWTSIALFLSATVVLGCLASGILPRVWQSQGPPSPSTSTAPNSLPLRPRIRKLVRRMRFRSLTDNPFFDLLLCRLKEFPWTKRFRRLTATFFFLMLLFSFVGRDEEPFVIALMTLLAMHVATKFTFAFDATRALNDDKRSSVLELLLATPLREQEIAHGQARAFHIQFRSHVWRLFLMTIALQFTAIFNSHLRLNGDDLFFISSFFWGPMIWTWSDYRTAPWLGMQHALKQSGHTKATLRTLLDMVLLPWAPYFFVLFSMAAANVDEEAAAAVTFLWAICGALFQLARAARKRASVIRDFRQIVSGANTPSPPIGGMLAPLRFRTKSHQRPGAGLLQTSS